LTNQDTAKSDSDSDSDNGEKRLLQVLIDAQIISEAQSQLAQSDSVNMSMSIDEVLLARGWLDAPTLEKHAPWLFPEIAEENARTTLDIKNDERTSNKIQLSDTHGSSDDYGFNLARYRAIVRDILD